MFKVLAHRAGQHGLIVLITCHRLTPTANALDCGWDGSDCYHGNTGCYVHPTGADYRGMANTTVSGKDCQYWSSLWPNEHTYVPSTYPDANLGGHNHCRNPEPADGATGPAGSGEGAARQWEGGELRAEALTVDHNIHDPAEMARLTAAGGHDSALTAAQGCGLRAASAGSAIDSSSELERRAKGRGEDHVHLAMMGCSQRARGS